MFSCFLIGLFFRLQDVRFSLDFTILPSYLNNFKFDEINWVVERLHCGFKIIAPLSIVIDCWLFNPLTFKSNTLSHLFAVVPWTVCQNKFETDLSGIRIKISIQSALNKSTATNTALLQWRQTAKLQHVLLLSFCYIHLLYFNHHLAAMLLR